MGGLQSGADWRGSSRRRNSRTGGRSRRPSTSPFHRRLSMERLMNVMRRALSRSPTALLWPDTPAIAGPGCSTTAELKHPRIRGARVSIVEPSSPAPTSAASAIVTDAFLTQPTVSHHLRILRDAVAGGRGGRWAPPAPRARGDRTPARHVRAGGRLGGGVGRRRVADRPEVLFVCIHDAGRSRAWPQAPGASVGRASRRTVGRIFTSGSVPHDRGHDRSGTRNVSAKRPTSDRRPRERGRRRRHDGAVATTCPCPASTTRDWG